jgi:uncharacterized RDD family membrane protein YckC
MKCPKCGYLGFETTDRCRNCQYDFSLAPFTPDPELTLHGAEHKIESDDFDLPAIKRQSDRLSASALDLDRLFGDPDPAASVPSSVMNTPPPSPPVPARKIEPPTITVLDDEAEIEATPATAMSIESSEVPPVAVAPADEGALPFDDGPIMPPPAARPPLAVRRSTPEVPRNRPRTTRPVRTEALDFEHDKSAAASAAAIETVASLMEIPSLGARISAGVIDALLLIGIDAAVLYLTLRVTGLQNSLEDLRVLPPVPFVGFLATLMFGYVAAFTVAGGQTIGKMVLSLRVIGDDGRPVDAAGGMLRALGCMLVPITLGLSYLPALFTSDHRALHDRLAGTRVVQE